MVLVPAEKSSLSDNIDDFCKRNFFWTQTVRRIMISEKWTNWILKLKTSQRIRKYAKEFTRKVTGIEPDESLPKLKEAVDENEIARLRKQWFAQWNHHIYLPAKTTDKANLDDELLLKRVPSKRLKMRNKRHAEQKGLENWTFSPRRSENGHLPASKQEFYQALANIKQEKSS